MPHEIRPPGDTSFLMTRARRLARPTPTSAVGQGEHCFEHCCKHGTIQAPSTCTGEWDYEHL